MEIPGHSGSEDTVTVFIKIINSTIITMLSKLEY